MISILRAVAFLICCSSLLTAKENHLVYDGDAYIYELTFDDSRISAGDMREIWWLSPWVGQPPIGPFNIFGQDIDKVFMVPRPDRCEPGANCSRNARDPDADFLENAARNLRVGDGQVKRLRKVKLPSVLEPVRSYLLLRLKLSLEREKARYRYLKSGDLGPLRSLLCACSCGTPEEALLQQLKTTSDFDTKIGLTQHQWHNQALECERKLYPPGYPMAAWKQFIKDFGIAEQRAYKQID
jgi:hypothetical protein